MDAGTRWQRLDAERWVHVFGMWQTALLMVWASVSLFGFWLSGVLWFAIFPAGIAALSGWLTAEWGRGRPWTWRAWTVLSCLGIALTMSLLAAGSPVKGLLGLASMHRTGRRRGSDTYQGSGGAWRWFLRPGSSMIAVDPERVGGATR